MTDVAAIAIEPTPHPPARQPVLPILHHCSAPCSCRCTAAVQQGRGDITACSQPITSFDYFKQHLLFVHRRTFWLFLLKVFSVALRQHDGMLEPGIRALHRGYGRQLWRDILTNCSVHSWKHSVCVCVCATARSHRRKTGEPFQNHVIKLVVLEMSNVCHIVHVGFLPSFIL